jgi:CcmD family protein
MSDALVLLFVAFAAVWIGLFFYLLYLDRQTRAVSAQLRDLSDRLSARTMEVEEVDRSSKPR